MFGGSEAMTANAPIDFEKGIKRIVNHIADGEFKASRCCKEVMRKSFEDVAHHIEEQIIQRAYDSGMASSLLLKMSRLYPPSTEGKETKS